MSLIDDIKINSLSEAYEILKGIGVDEELLEKAHKDGDLHPNGKWVWVSSAAGGKGDWRTLNGRTHKKHQATNSSGGATSAVTGSSDNGTDTTKQPSNKTAVMSSGATKSKGTINKKTTTISQNVTNKKATDISKKLWDKNPSEAIEKMLKKNNFRYSVHNISKNDKSLDIYDSWVDVGFNIFPDAGKEVPHHTGLYATHAADDKPFVFYIIDDFKRSKKNAEIFKGLKKAGYEEANNWKCPQWGAWRFVINSVDDLNTIKDVMRDALKWKRKNK